MKQVMLKVGGLLVATLAMAVILTGCGGGSKKSGLKSNELVGNLPAIHADYQLELDALKEKAAKVTKSGDLKKMMQEAAKEAKASTERYAKHEAAVTAEWKKIDGRTVPFTKSADFAAGKIEVSGLKLSADKRSFTALITAKEDLKVHSMNGPDYEYAHYRVLAKDGSVISTGSFFLLTTLSAWKGLDFAKGQSLHYEGKEAPGGALNISDKWVDFASIEFITKEEWLKK